MPKIIRPGIDDIVRLENEQPVDDTGIYAPNGRRIFKDNIGHFTSQPTLNPVLIGMEREYIRLNSDNGEEGYLHGRIIPFLRKTGKVAAVIGIGIILGAGVASATPFNLEIHNNFDDGMGMITGDRFFAAYDPNNPQVTNLYNFGIDLIEVMPPPGKNVQIYTIDTGVPLMKEFRVYDPNIPDLLWPIKLVANDTSLVGFTGTNYVDIANPTEIDKIPENVLIYFTRYNAQGIAVQNYDLRDPNNHSIEWPVENAIGPYTTIELIIKDKCLAANLDKIHPINLNDFAILANHWQKTGSNPGDINGDNRTDFKDLKVMVDYWLVNCLANR